MTNMEVLESIREGKSSNNSQLQTFLLLAVTLAAFAWLGAIHWDTQFTVLLVIAIFVHELGHLAAMKMFRYKNLKMLFLPLIGGLAQGEPDNHDAFKIAIISYAGPLVGILSCWGGIALWHSTHQKIYIDYAILALILNLFNLLPILPLDGGHILNELLFSRYPKVEAAFRVFAAVGLGLLAYKLQSWIFGGLAYFMLVSLSLSYKLSRTVVRLRTQEGFPGENLTEGKVAIIREELKGATTRYEDNRHIKNLPKVIKNLWMRSNKVFPSVSASTFVLILYVAGTVALSVGTFAGIYGARSSRVAHAMLARYAESGSESKTPVRFTDKLSGITLVVPGGWREQHAAATDPAKVGRLFLMHEDTGDEASYMAVALGRQVLPKRNVDDFYRAVAHRLQSKVGSVLLSKSDARVGRDNLRAVRAQFKATAKNHVYHIDMYFFQHGDTKYFLQLMCIESRYKEAKSRFEFIRAHLETDWRKTAGE